MAKEQYRHPVNPETLQKGLVIDGNLGEVAVIAEGYNPRKKNWFVFYRNAESDGINGCRAEVDQLKKSHPISVGGAEYVMGVGVIEEFHGFQYHYDKIGIWVRASKEVDVIPTKRRVLHVVHNRKVREEIA